MASRQLELVRFKEHDAWINLRYLSRCLGENHPYLLRARSIWRTLAELVDELEEMEEEMEEDKHE